MLQTHFVPSRVDVPKLKKIATHQSFHIPTCKIDSADNVRLTIGHIKRLTIGCNPRGLGKAGFQTRSIESRFATGASERGHLICVEIQLPNLMWTGHGDIENSPDQLQI